MLMTGVVRNDVDQKFTSTGVLRPGGPTQNDDLLKLYCCAGPSGLMIPFITFRGLAAPAEVVSGLRP
jgi:hypothetical protein